MPLAVFFARQCFVLILLLALLTQVTVRSATASATLIWDASPDPNIEWYSVYYGEVETGTINRVRVGRRTTVVIPELALGKKYLIYVTATDEFGRESRESNAIEYIRKEGSPIANVQAVPLPDLDQLQIVDGPELPAIVSHQLAGGQLSLSWNDAAVGMRLQLATSLSEADWKDVPESEHGDVISLPTSAQNAFFRLIKR